MPGRAGEGDGLGDPPGTAGSPHGLCAPCAAPARVCPSSQGRANCPCATRAHLSRGNQEERVRAERPRVRVIHALSSLCSLPGVWGLSLLRLGREEEERSRLGLFRDGGVLCVHCKSRFVSGPVPSSLSCQDAPSLPCPGPARSSSSSFPRAHRVCPVPRCAPRQRGTSGCSSRSRSWPRPCRAPGSARPPPLPHPRSAPPGTAPAPSTWPCPRRRAEAACPRSWPPGTSCCPPKLPPCSCPAPGTASLSVRGVGIGKGGLISVWRDRY